MAEKEEIVGCLLTTGSLTRDKVEDIAEVIVRTKNGSEDLYEDSARNLLTAAMIYTMYSSFVPDEDKTFKYMYDAVINETFEGLHRIFLRLGNDHPAYYYFRLFSTDEEEVQRKVFKDLKATLQEFLGVTTNG